MNDCDAIPLYTAQARDEVIDPDFTSPDYGMAVPPYEEPVDPDFSVMPDTGVPCVFCNNHQWIHGAVRLLNAAAGYNPFTVLIDNQLAYTGLESPEITEYRQIPQGYHKIYLSEIECLEAQNKKAIFHLCSGKVQEALGTFSNYAKPLTIENGFFKCHRSYIVSIPQVDHFNTAQIRTRSGMQVPIARGYGKEFKEVYFAYMFQKETTND